MTDVKNKPTTRQWTGGTAAHIAIAIGAVALPFTSASAQITNNPNQDTAIHLLCPMTATVSPNTPNPPISAEITGGVKGKNGVWLEIVYTMLNGSKVRRGDQYISTQIWVDKNSGDLMWSGIYARDPGRSVEGRISGLPQAMVYCAERHFTNGVEDSTTTTTCLNPNASGDNNSKSNGSF